MSVVRMPVYKFADVRTAAARHNIKARLYLFDGGETVELTNVHGVQLARVTSQWGDEASAPELAALWLMENTTTSVFDFVGA